MSDTKLLLKTSRFHVEQVSQTLADGGTRQREIVRHPGSVVILPMVDDEHVCLIRNYRIAVADTLIELPAGTLEEDEPMEQAAARELIEETGYEAGSIAALNTFYPSPGILDERMHLYLATQLREVGAAREPGEEIENQVMPWSAAIQLVFNGQIRDAKTIIGLLYADYLRRSDATSTGKR